ncbi:transglycosylase SLT domain-containing protein [Xanthomonas citri]|uniref:transglycosylase SLT domain-containing protein n=1 Tax=Xanthomonas citri TaxID=346 RepID=UPI0035686832
MIRQAPVWWLALAFALGVCGIGNARSQELPPPTYRLAAAQAGVPSPLLYAVALQESGTRLQGRQVPWPWTLNVAGAPYRYATRAGACRGLRQALLRTSPRRIDVGLVQVNAGYHGKRVAQPCALLDPYRNLVIAAEILHEQHTPGEDWLVAAGRYHRPAGGIPAARYRSSVHRHLVRVLGSPHALSALNTHQGPSP